MHETSVQSKAIVRAFYGKDPSISYFEGCSKGGGEALMEVQRFPEDFDGIVAGAPANALTHLSAGLLWTGTPQRSRLDDNRRQTAGVISSGACPSEQV